MYQYRHVLARLRQGDTGREMRAGPAKLPQRSIARGALSRPRSIANVARMLQRHRAFSRESFAITATCAIDLLRYMTFWLPRKT